MKKRRPIKKGNQYKKDIDLLCLLANESTGKARLLLKKNGVEAVNHADLEIKLANAYRESSDKVEFEKQLAEIHPHKDFIIKYCAPTLPEKNLEVEEQIIAAIKEPLANDMSSAACGCKPVEPVSNACGCQSGFSGKTETSAPKPIDAQNNNLIALAVVSVFALSLVIIASKISKS